MKLLILFAFLGLTIGLSAQDFLKCEKFPLKLKKHYTEAEPCIDKLCDLVVDAPMRAYSDEVHEALKLLATYAKDPSHKVVMNKKIKKFIKNIEDGKFESYLK